MSAKISSSLQKETLEDALQNAISEIQSLAEEMRSWADGMESSDALMATVKYELVTECADTLENVDTDIKLPESLDGSALVSYNEQKKRGFPRWLRLGNALAVLQAIVDHVEEIIDELEEKSDDADVSDLEDFRDELQNIIDELQGVEFPSMYG